MNVYKQGTLHLNSSVMSIGAFDGLHKGHQSLIESNVTQARRLNIPSVVYTFDPPPRAYFQNSQILTSLEEKIELINHFNVDYIIVAKFDNHYASRSAAKFLAELKNCHPEEIFVGSNFTFGKGREGDVPLLTKHFNVTLPSLITCEKGEVISSSRIRELIKENNFTQAFHLLGHPTRALEQAFIEKQIMKKDFTL